MTTEILTYLLTSAWQLPLLAVCTSICLHSKRNTSVIDEYRMWVLCLLAAVFAPLVSMIPFSHNPFLSRFIISLAEPTPLPGYFSSLAKAPTVSNMFVLNHAHLGYRGCLVQLYLITILFALARLLWRLLLTGYVVSSSKPFTLSKDLQDEYPHLSNLPAKCNIHIRCTRHINAPATVSWPIPLLLFPSYLLQVHSSEMVAAIEHELAHIKRRDFYVNLLLEVLQTLVFYHPVTHFTKKHIDSAREHVCDEIAAGHIGRRSYANSLLLLAKTAREPVPFAGYSLSALQTPLEDRIMTLLKPAYQASFRQRLLQSVTIGFSFSLVGALGLFLNARPALAQIGSAGQIPPGHQQQPSLEYDVQAIAHGTKSSITVKEDPSLFTYRWLDAEGVPVMIASHERREPTLSERAQIEHNYPSPNQQSAEAKAASFPTASDNVTSPTVKEDKSSADILKQKTFTAQAQLVPGPGVYVHRWVGADGQPFVISDNNPGTLSSEEQSNIEHHLRVATDEVRARAALLQQAGTR